MNHARERKRAGRTLFFGIARSEVCAIFSRTFFLSFFFFSFFSFFLSLNFFSFFVVFAHFLCVQNHVILASCSRTSGEKVYAPW